MTYIILACLGILILGVLKTILFGKITIISPDPDNLDNWDISNLQEMLDTKQKLWRIKNSKQL